MQVEAHDESGEFPRTEWSLVGRAAGEGSGGRRALGAVLQRYTPALRAYLLAKWRLDAEAADELVQGFLADKVVEQGLLGLAQKDRGKLRSFLLTSLNNYVITEFRRRRAGGGAAAPLDGTEAADSGGDPGHLFSVAWARELVADAVGRMRADCERSGRTDLWVIFDQRVVQPALHGNPPAGYSALVDQLHLSSPLQACNLLSTAKRMFARILRAAAADSTGGGGSAEEEISELRRIVSRGGARGLRRRVARRP